MTKKDIRILMGEIPVIFARLFGTKLKDYYSGRVFGKAVVIPWFGRILIIGYRGVPIRPIFLPQAHTKFYCQTLSFSPHPTPDFPSLLEQPSQPEQPV